MLDNNKLMIGSLVLVVLVHGIQRIGEAENVSLIKHIH